MGMNRKDEMPAGAAVDQSERGAAGHAGGKGAQPVRREAALDILFEHWEVRRDTEILPVEKAYGRVLAREYYAKFDIPVVRASSMDGIAVDSARFAEGVPDTEDWRIGEDFVRADTGDDFDDKFDAVILIEDVELLENGGVRIHDDVDVVPGLNVKGKGSSLSRGTVLAKKGLPLRATDLAAIAMGGVSEVEVVRKPKVTFIPTGSELVPIGSELERGQNFNTNSLMAYYMLQEMGAEPVCTEIVPDDRELLRKTLMDAVENSDVVIINGGSSKGSEDFNTKLLGQEGELLLHGVAAGPGRPMGIAIIKGRPVINLAGPSVAAFYGMDWCIRGIVSRFLGIPAEEKETVRATLTEEMGGAKRFDFLNRVEIFRDGDGYSVTPMSRGKADLPAMLSSNGMFISPIGKGIYDKGSEIDAVLLRNRALIPDKE